jgi:membrane protease YdiL (CAAX protease family)
MEAGSRTSIRAAAAHAAVGAGHPTSVSWSIPEVIAVASVMVALLLAKDVVLSTDQVRSLGVGGFVAVRAATQLAYYGVLLALLAWLARRHGMGFRSAYGLVGFPVFSSVAWAIAGLVSIRVFTLLYGAVTQVLGWEPPLRSTSELTDLFGADWAGLLFGAVIVVVIGPFVEEIVFRGLLLGAFRQQFGARVAIGASAIVFAASHLTLWTLVPLAVLGAFLGWLVLAKGSVWPAFAVHALYNAVPLVAAFYVSGALGV